MGDRSVTLIVDGTDVAACAVYTHSRGGEAVEDLKAAIPRMREGDADYSTARLIGELHAKMKGNSGLGVLPPPGDLKPETLKEYSHGDAGVLVYDCRSGTLQAHGGYMAKRLEEGAIKWEPAIPPK